MSANIPENKIHVIQADYSNPNHARDLLYLLNAYALDPMGGATPLAESVKEILIAELAKRSFAISLIAYVDERPAGLLNAFEGFSTFAAKPLLNIHDVVVVQEFRGLGVCQRLLHTIEGIARVRGCCKLTLEVLQGNNAAEQAYLKFGFTGYQLNSAVGHAQFWQKKLNSLQN